MKAGQQDQSCPRCQFRVEPGNQFCGNCGLLLVDPNCPVCGAKVISGDGFCRNCGTALARGVQIVPLVVQTAPPAITAPVAANFAASHSRQQVAAVGLLAILAAKPLLKTTILFALAAFLLIGGVRSGLGIVGSLILAGIAILFILKPRRQR